MKNMTFLFELIYLVCAILFVLGIRQLANPKTARNGNMLSMTAMLLAVAVSMVLPVEGGQNYSWIFVGVILGSIVGLIAAKKVAITAMPEMVSLFNGVGGACALIISIVQLSYFADGTAYTTPLLITILFTLFIGAVSFTGSLVAYGKLSGIIRKLKLPFNQIINFILLVANGVFIYLIGVADTIEFNQLVVPFIVVSLLYGFTFVTPVGGADMPVIISLLNSFTGVTSLLAGIIYQNQIVILGGILVGSSGTILTILMSQAMNRSIINVLIGGLGSSTSSGTSDDGVEKTYRTATIDDVAIMVNYARSVVFVPGYGMAVAQAQKTCKDLEVELNKKGVEVKYAIHPVAGRMPGHMNVLLAEANVDYDNLMDLETSNDYLPDADVAIVVGANDVVNPAATEKKDSPIYGMPIINLTSTANTIVIKRSMNTGYAGIDNDIFYREKTNMLFGDAKSVLQDLLTEVKGL